MDDPETIRNLNVIQDFNNKKANAHATIFVASMFALFTVLSLAARIAQKLSLDSSSQNFYIIGFSIGSYWLIWAFGLYSLGNFTYYSTVSAKAKDNIVGDMELQLIKKYKNEWSIFLKKFANFKLNESQWLHYVRNHNEGMSIFIYFLIGLLPFVAFIIWVFSG